MTVKGGVGTIRYVQTTTLEGFALVRRYVENYVENFFGSGNVVGKDCGVEGVEKWCGICGRKLG